MITHFLLYIYRCLHGGGMLDTLTGGLLGGLKTAQIDLSVTTSPHPQSGQRKMLGKASIFQEKMGKKETSPYNEGSLWEAESL